MAVREAPAAARGSGRERILDAAYGLFSRSGVRAIGVDTITAEADVAKMTLYPGSTDPRGWRAEIGGGRLRGWFGGRECAR